MISAEKAIKTVQRDLTLTAVMKGFFVAGAVVLTAVLPSYVSGAPFLVMIAGAGLWMALTFYNVRGSSMAADSPLLIATGQFDEAEQEIEKVIRSFWLFRPVKLMSIHHLAVLRHAKRQWRDSVLLSQALLKQRLSTMPAIARTTRLMLADSLLELGDLAGADQALMTLYTQKVTLSEAMNLLVVQLEYESRVGAWASMFHNIRYKVQLAELMPASSAARTQALLAVAARNLGQTDWSEWLRRRAELLADINELTAHRPILKELFKNQA